MKQNVYRLLILCFALLLLCGCASGRPGDGPTDTPEPTEEPDPSTIPETTTPPTAVPEPSPSPEPTASPEPTPTPRPEKQIRVSIGFEEDLSLDEGIARVEQALGHELDVVWRFESIRVVSVWIGPGELEPIRQVEGVRTAEEENLNSPGGVKTAG